jgi:hypothetical protein
MKSASLAKFEGSMIGSKILAGFYDSVSTISPNQEFTSQCLFRSAVACAVGCWEGYIESALKEFVSKTRLQTHRKAWTLIVQFESLVDKLAADFNTPNWDKSRELILSVTGMDPYSSWVWRPYYANANDTKTFFNGILQVRHSFAHGFPVPHDIPGLSVAGKLDTTYVNDAIACLEFFAQQIDALLEHELKHRHGCNTGWN